MPLGLHALMADATARLAAAGVETARLDARLLFAHGLKLDPHRVALEPNLPIHAAKRRRIEALIERRLRREPVSRIVGQREFWSLDFAISPATLDPRPDSETLVETVLRSIDKGRALTILDLGTGSGCLVLALLSELKQATGTGIDRSAAAIRVARRNGKTLGLSDRVRFITGDWSRTKLPPADIVISNPPYIAEAEIAGLAPETSFDPPGALLGGADGLDAYRAIVDLLPRVLAETGFVAFEIGHTQANSVRVLLAENGFIAASAIKDLAGLDRVVIAQRDARSCHAREDHGEAKKGLE